ncbi:transmembrane protein, putative (macronuclear) [Tetrahymena thermophila SB210]|uniref:Transmembrane protein, putative n=1 Tax=Tetrahymena thermophila (strain SB210) TaxID=312017 RepID=W7X764_TETTS|nr:transmembrane protein, putative [Tetrahymena thermophila SB210]EWS73202.1 transmembrane protein, putative [Tetrahymena thermophila SB210]|eukprot:XP_012654278.1 transmembrane protein, putative [Tetrahymena thermophila SB210]
MLKSNKTHIQQQRKQTNQTSTKKKKNKVLSQSKQEFNENFTIIMKLQLLISSEKYLQNKLFIFYFMRECNLMCTFQIQKKQRKLEKIVYNQLKFDYNRQEYLLLSVQYLFIINASTILLIPSKSTQFAKQKSIKFTR